MANERKIISAILKDRKSWEKLKGVVDPAAELSPESALLYRHADAFYTTDPAASECDLDIIKNKIEREVQSNKLIKVLHDLLDNLPTVSASNLTADVVEVKRHGVGLRLASMLAAGRTGADVDGLIEQYKTMVGSAVGLEDAELENVVSGVNVSSIIKTAMDPSSLIKIAPKSLNDRLDGGILPGHHIVILAPTEMGKCHHIDTPVLMWPTGVKMIQDISVGDTVMGPDSGPRTVTRLGRGRQQMFDIKYNFGDSHRVNLEHQLSLCCPTKSHELVTVSVKNYLQWSNNRKRLHKLWKTGVEYRHVNTTFPAYELGLWLGDGTSSAPSVTTMDKEVAEAWCAFGSRLGLSCRIQTLKNNKAKTYHLHGDGAVNTATKMLRDIHVLNDKHIPDAYLFNDSDTRRALLAGLLDTDGYWSGRSWEITQVRENLARQIVWLARSLGIHATLNIKRVNSKFYYRVMIYPHQDCNIPIRVQHKKQTFSAAKPKRSGLYFGFDVIPAAIEDYYGIEVAGVDSLYLLGDFTVTHNTLVAINMVAGFLHQKLRCLYVANEDPIEDILLRLGTRLSGMNKYEIRDNPERAQKLIDGRAGDLFTIAPLAPGNFTQIANLVKKYEPKVIILDQLRNIDVQSENRTQSLEKAATEARNLGKRFGLGVISITQAGDSATGRRVLRRGDVDGSNVGIPAQADVMMGISGTEEDEAQNIRTLSFPKNKRSGNHHPIQVQIDPALSKVIDL